MPRGFVNEPAQSENGNFKQNVSVQTGKSARRLFARLDLASLFSRSGIGGGRNSADSPPVLPAKTLPRCLNNELRAHWQSSPIQTRAVEARIP
jgi:hypothetical protein